MWTKVQYQESIPPLRLSAMTPAILGLALALSLGSAGVAAETTVSSGPLGFVKSSVARVLAIVQSSPMGSDERRTGIVRVSHELFDFNEISRRALGQHWKGLSPAEQDEFVELFTDVLERAFITSVDGYANEKVTFVGEAIDGAWAEVRSRIIPKQGAAVSVDYRLHEGNSRWTVYDVLSERVSLAASYRSQFNSVLRTASFAELLGRMRRREPSAHTPLAPDPLAAELFRHPHTGTSTSK